MRLDDAARQRVGVNRRGLLDAMASGEPIYGVNTGFGSLATQRIADESLRDLQRNLIRSHAAGAGAALPEDVVRAMLVILGGSLVRARSGVRAEVVDAIVALLNTGVTPIVPEIGSVGASGDLAPLAHVALVLIGEGHARQGGRVVSGEQALAAARIKPIVLQAKEGLALINGTHLMAGRMALLHSDWERIESAAILATALSIDACRATDSFLDDRVYIARNQPGAVRAAERLRDMLAGSQIIPSHRVNDPRVQDPYSFRCAPIVLGSVLETLDGVWAALERELGAVTDNPLVFPSRGEAADPAAGVEVISAGNFHGMPIALPMDVLAICLAHVAGIAERRVYHMLSALEPGTGLSPFLSHHPGLESGLMVAQYTAAACCNELAMLATPASVRNIPTSAGMEDYNSFGPAAAAKAARAMDLTRTVVAIELLCGVEALDRHRPLRSGPAVERVRETIRGVVPPYRGDRPPSPDIAAIEGLIRNGAFENRAGGE